MRKGRIRIGNRWWRWDEEGEMLTDEKGKIRGEIERRKKKEG